VLIRTIAFGVLGGIATLVVAPAVEAAQETVRRDSERVLRCESGDGDVKRCLVDTRRGVRMLRELSETPCEEGRSWGVEAEAIWVRDGCRAEFLTGFGGSGIESGYSEKVVRCESRGGRWNQCPAETATGLEMVRQLSKNPCIRGQNWGWDKSGVWVSGGCRGEFRALGTREERQARIRVVRCESQDSRPQQCQVDTGGIVKLRRQLSKAPCIEGRSWGYDRGGIWVERGCRADFEIGGGDG
jgi:hypothetical protein